jgi:hypothetical protein
LEEKNFVGQQLDYLSFYLSYSAGDDEYDGFDINKNFNLHSLICYFIIVEKGSTLSYY